MTALERQVLHLVGLMLQLRYLCRSSMVTVTSYGQPALYVPLLTGDKLKITVVLEGENWFFAWGRRERAAIGQVEIAAKQITSLVRS